MKKLLSGKIPSIILTFALLFSLTPLPIVSMFRTVESQTCTTPPSNLVS